MRDKVFDKKIDLVDFKFNKEVVDVFNDMVRRSVPGYELMLKIISLIARIYGKDNTNFYDLGASLGAVSLALNIACKHKNIKTFAIDNSKEMTIQCSKNLKDKIPSLVVICADIEDIAINNASIVVLNLTLQFIKPSKRLAIIDKIYQGLNKGGVLIISEKTHFENQATDTKINDLYTLFKKANGYSDLEIAQKRSVLDNILITDTEATHIQRLKRVGFSQIIRWYQCINFTSILAVK